MNNFKTLDLLDPFSGDVFYRETSVFQLPTPFFPAIAPATVAVKQEMGFALDFLNPSPISLDHLAEPSPFDLFDNVTDLIQIDGTPFSSTYRRVQERKVTDLYLKSLCDRVSALELGLDRAIKGRTNGGDRKYKWTAEIKGAGEKSYKWTAEARGNREKSYKWTAEIKGKGLDGPISRTYTLTASTAKDEIKNKIEEKIKSDNDKVKKKKTNDNNVGSRSVARVVDIEEPQQNHAAIILKQAFARSRAAATCSSKGKKKELSFQDAALMIQMCFRAHLVRRSQVLRAFRELALAKEKLKELRALFSNIAYRRLIASNAEECQRFSEKIIVLLLTVDDVQGLDVMVRATKRSMIAELETMLDMVDPQPAAKLGSMKRRKFDLPENGPLLKEMALGVSEVVQLLDQEDNASTALA